MTERRPACPDCGDKGIKVRGNYFRCSNTDCNAVWQEFAWEKRIVMERIMLDESERLAGVVSLIVIAADLLCDTCGRLLYYGEKYCYNNNEPINGADDGLHPIVRGKRYCKKCSLRAGYLRIARNKSTGEEYAVLLLASNEEWVD